MFCIACWDGDGDGNGTAAVADRPGKTLRKGGADFERSEV